MFVCRCIRFINDEKAFNNVIKSDGFRCVCCMNAANDLGVHSLIPADEIHQDLCVTVCYWCHVKVATGKIVIKNHPKAASLLSEWAKKYPKAVIVHKKYFPEEYYEGSEKEREDKD
jgi:hypothetical protein